MGLFTITSSETIWKLGAEIRENYEIKYMYEYIREKIAV
jgi:hypothetical protein